MENPMEIDPTKYTRKRLMVTLRARKDDPEKKPQVVLEADDQSGVAVAIFGDDSPEARADAARVMRLWNNAQPGEDV